MLFAVNFERLNVHMNMGNVMGNVRSVSRFTVAVRLKMDWRFFSFFFNIEFIGGLVDRKRLSRLQRYF